MSDEVQVMHTQWRITLSRLSCYQNPHQLYPLNCACPLPPRARLNAFCHPVPFLLPLARTLPHTSSGTQASDCTHRIEVVAEDGAVVSSTSFGAAAPSSSVAAAAADSSGGLASLRGGSSSSGAGKKRSNLVASMQVCASRRCLTCFCHVEHNRKSQYNGTQCVMSYFLPTCADIDAK